MSAHDQHKPKPLETLTRGYASRKPPAKSPISFTPRADMERLRTLRQADPQAFDRLGPISRIDFGYYEAARKAAGYEEGEDDHGDTAA